MKLIKKILNSVNSDRKYIAIYKKLKKSLKNYHFLGYFLEMGSQVFMTTEV